MSFKHELLELIKDIGSTVGDYAASPYEFNRKVKIAIKAGSGYRGSHYYSTLSRLEKDGLINKKKSGKYVSFKITETGKRFLKRRSKMVKRADGFSTVVVFDIPENRHTARNNFRRYLIRNGFLQLQKSVLIGPYKFSTEIKDLAREMDILSFITILSARIDRI